VKEAKASATKWATLYKKISQQHMAEPADAAKPVSQIGIAFLQWEATTKAADTAWARLWPALIDLNDMRVSHPHEIIEMIGSRYPRAAERVDRLHDVLQEIYVREHEMSMRSLQNKGKKEVRAYLESLPGIVPYVSAQILLICYEGHAIPVDQTLANLLKIQGVASEDASV
jgi:endonuclease III